LTDKAGNDNFQAIKGIAPVFAKRLKDAGVTTFDQLFRLTPKDLEEILGKIYKRFFPLHRILLH
jgi:predicted flap endonuclease-1-like 5' DNA nuclease